MLRFFLPLALVVSVVLVVMPSRAAGGDVDVHAGSELSAYTDTDRTRVLTPAVFASAENELARWGIGGSFLVDVVSAASADIVATASPGWTEVRYAPALSAHRGFGDLDIALRTSASVEPDYLSFAGGAAVSLDTLAKTVTLRAAYDFSHDTVGRAQTPFSVFSHPIARHSVDLGATFVLDRATIAMLSTSFLAELGDGSKPYRHIPMFDAATAPMVSAGASVGEVDALRRFERPLEQLPLERYRIALDGRVLHRFSSATLRLEQRFYADSWGLRASTTDVEVPIDFSERFRSGPHVRFNIQNGVTFWRRAYVVTDTANGIVLPALRTGDRELGPLLGPTLGIRSRLAVGKVSALSLNLEGGYTRFLDHLYISHRFDSLAAFTYETDF